MRDSGQPHELSGYLLTRQIIRVTTFAGCVACGFPQRQWNLTTLNRVAAILSFDTRCQTLLRRAIDAMRKKVAMTMRPPMILTRMS